MPSLDNLSRQLGGLAAATSSATASGDGAAASTSQAESGGHWPGTDHWPAGSRTNALSEASAGIT